MLTRYALKIGLGTVTIFLSTTLHLWAKERPVVVIPGIMGSKLCDGAGKVVWGDRLSYTKSRIIELRLPPDINTRDLAIHSCGLIDKVNIIPLLWESEEYSDLLSTLKEIGYKENEIVQFDYDWRLSNFYNADKLKQAIFSLQRTPSDKVDIIAHSMGGLIARIYIQTLGGTNEVNNVLFLGTPHLGSASIFQRLQEGFEKWPSALSGGLNEIETTILSFPSTYQLLPVYEECCGFSSDGNPVTANYVDVLEDKTWSRFSWLPQEYKSGPRADALHEFLGDAKKQREIMKQPIFNNADGYARVHFVANGFMETWSRVFFDTNTGNILSNTLSPGDGTVLLYSATNGVPGQVQISHKEHALVFGGAEPKLVIKGVLEGGQEFHAGNTDFAQSLLDGQGERFQVQSALYKLTPKIVGPEQVVNIEVSLAGDLGGADLSNVRVRVFGDTGLIKESILQSSQITNGGERSLTAAIVAPKEQGSYRVEISISGLENVSQMFAVVSE